MKEISDPLYGFVKLTPLELKLVDSVTFQRLRYIKQLGLAFLVFPSAHHTRFEHSLGVLHITDAVAERLGLKEKELLRLSALLHDLGHPPFSHTTESLLPEGMNHEDFTEKLVRETEVWEVLKEELSEEEIEKVLRIALGRPKDEEEKALSLLITGQLGTDRMDYLRRDAYFCGVPYGHYDYLRLLSTLRLEEGELAVEESGLRALEDFFLSRYFMYVQVYFHKVVRILSIHLMELTEKLLGKERLADASSYAELNDALLIAQLFEREDLKEYRDRLLRRRHFRTLLSTSDREEYLKAKEKLLTRYPEELFRFDELYKEPYEGGLYILEKGKRRKAEELSPLLSSLKPVEIYRIYAEPSLWEEASSLIKA